ncbi:MAG: relaxase/mobilization nuclease domain-containing protein, partial [Sulfurihydrogenibium sp.]
LLHDYALPTAMQIFFEFFYKQHKRSDLKMKGTIHYIGDITYIKDEGHLREVINYITRNFKLGRSLTTLTEEKKEIWLQRAKDEKAARKNSRIALRFHLSLPNDQRNNIEFRKKVIKKLTELFGIPSHHIDVAFHLDSPNNYHMHILIYPRGKDGKKLRLERNDLQKIHREWDKFLQSEGYNVKKNGNNKVFKKSIWQYTKEKAKEMGYIPIPAVALDEELLTKGKERFLEKMKKRNIEIKETEIYIFEDIIEKEAIRIAENQTVRKVLKTKEYLNQQSQNQNQQQPQNQPQHQKQPAIQPQPQNQQPQKQQQKQPNNQKRIQDYLQKLIKDNQTARDNQQIIQDNLQEPQEPRPRMRF